MTGFSTGELGPDTWDAFAELVERNGGIFGGCWCIGWHPECGRTDIDHRTVKHQRVLDDAAHAALVFDGDGRAQGWCQYGSPTELSNIKHRRRHDEHPPTRPDWRIACFYVDKRHRRTGIARLALETALDQIGRHGGGLVEAIPETVTGRTAHGRFLFSTTVELFEQYGFERVRRVGKHAWIVSRVVPAAESGPDR